MLLAVKTNYKKNGNDYFRVTLSLGRDAEGKIIRKEFYGKSKKEAEDKKNEYLNDLKSGFNPDIKNVPLYDAMNTWLFEVVKHSGIKASTFERYESIYRNYVLNSDIALVKVADFKSIIIQKYYNKLVSDNKTDSQINNLHKILKKFFNYALNEGYIIRNPCSGIKYKSINSSNKEVEVFKDEEIRELVSSIKGNRIKVVILLALGTGLRQGELLALTWDDIDLNNCVLKVDKSIKQVTVIHNSDKRHFETIISAPKTKNAVREVPIPSSLIKELKKQKVMQNEDRLKAGSSYDKDSAFVFTTELGHPIDARNLTRAYKRAIKKAGIPYRKFHALRHTYATKLFEQNAPLKTISMLLGHSSIKITADTYTHVMPKEKTKVVENLNILFN